MKINRNDLCPCGSGKKFKKCHFGRENELEFNEPEEISLELSKRITELPVVLYGRAGEIVGAIDIKALTGSSKGIKFIDLKAYSELTFFGSKLADEGKAGGGSVFVNIYKTQKGDPDNVYIAISPGVNESVLAHQLAHALDFIGGSKLMPGLGQALSMELEVPVEHLEHPQEYGYWLGYLKDNFKIELDADDTIVHYLFSHDKLLKGEDIQNQDNDKIKEQSKEMLTFLNAHSAEINALIRERDGYIGEQKQVD